MPQWIHTIIEIIVLGNTNAKQNSKMFDYATFYPLST